MDKDIAKIKNVMAMMSSMIHCGENHDEKSLKLKDEAFEALGRVKNTVDLGSVRLPFPTQKEIEAYLHEFGSKAMPLDSMEITKSVWQAGGLQMAKWIKEKIKANEA